jgi:hypothetical protein
VLYLIRFSIFLIYHHPWFILGGILIGGGAGLYFGGMTVAMLIEGVAWGIVIGGILENLKDIIAIISDLSSFIYSAYKNLRILFSRDPNEKVGPTGVLTNRYIRLNAPLVYTIYFENLANATIGAQIVNITDQLPKELNWTTFRLLNLKISNRTLDIPTNLQNYSYVMDLRPEINVTVEIQIRFNKITGFLSCNYKALDPISKELDRDGFLPPNKFPPTGEGAITFLVWPNSNLTTGTWINNSANITFDTNEIILTNTWSNLVDNDAPNSTLSVKSSALFANKLTITVSGEDLGAGIMYYDLYKRVKGESNYTFLMRTNLTQISIDCEFGKTYQFLVIATDWVGFVEQKSSEFDVEKQIRLEIKHIAIWTGLLGGMISIVIIPTIYLIRKRKLKTNPSV